MKTNHLQIVGLCGNGAKRVALLAVALMCAACAPVKHEPVRTPAVKLTDPVLHYPPQAIRQLHEGTATLIVLVDTTGLPADIRVELSSGYRELDMAAINGVKGTRFKPAAVDGVPIQSYVRMPIVFHLNHPTLEQLPTMSPAPPMLPGS